jgi:hypothetical protein
MTQTRTPHMTDYEAERRNFHLEVPEYFNFATDVIGKWASDPNKLAMLWIGQTAKLARSLRTEIALFVDAHEWVPAQRHDLGIQPGGVQAAIQSHDHRPMLWQTVRQLL